jgi:hypothetical protein
MYFGKQTKSGKLQILCALRDQGRLNYVKEAPHWLRSLLHIPGVFLVKPVVNAV